MFCARITKKEFLKIAKIHAFEVDSACQLFADIHTKKSSLWLRTLQLLIFSNLQELELVALEVFIELQMCSMRMCSLRSLVTRNTPVSMNDLGLFLLASI